MLGHRSKYHADGGPVPGTGLLPGFPATTTWTGRFRGPGRTPRASNGLLTRS